MLTLPWWPFFLGILLVFSGLKWQRKKIYSRMSLEQKQLIERMSLTWQSALRLPAERPSFNCGIVRMSDVIESATFAHIKAVVARTRRSERRYIPSHKKGGTISYEHLYACAPDLVAFYQSTALRDLVSEVVGVAVVPTPLHDQSSCSLLVYERPKDHIGWHYDHNFYHGRHFTVLLSMVNEDRVHGGLSATRLQANIDGQVEEIPTPANTLVIFEGARVLHRVTPLEEQQTRILLSMTFCTNPNAPWYKENARRIKDMAYYGVRALWT